MCERTAADQPSASTTDAIEAACAVSAQGCDGDVELIHLCREFKALEDMGRSSFPGGINHIENDADRDRYMKPICDMQEAILARICELRAVTKDAMIARAQALVAFSPDLLDEPSAGYWDQRLLAALLRDMTAQRPLASTIDAEFLRLAARAQEAQAAFVASVERWADVVHMPPDAEAEQDRLFLVADDLRRQAMSMPARTAADLRAKARMVLDTIGLDDNDVLPPGDQDFPAWSLARDLLGGWA
ncbi:hypothetical protein HLH36_02605 [Gluconacetobacter aggeris]|uniref:Uncharacterized protein n=1 Tax=Gluconacetobacter aggeris TaxID=1286186 RepID=A0A7W4IQR3_9PROT|nr:hypothetical protein [Gluconacetobacter aggeris]MBB2167257.1 hypothetical protein [Gluconacetobacter aggeris]